MYNTKRSGLGRNTTSKNINLQCIYLHHLTRVLFVTWVYPWLIWNTWNSQAVSESYSILICPEWKYFVSLSWDALWLLSIISSQRESWKSVSGHSVLPFAPLKDHISVLFVSIYRVIYLSEQSFNLFSKKKTVSAQGFKGSLTFRKRSPKKVFISCNVRLK